MEDLTRLLDSLKAKHSEIFMKDWKSVSVNDAKRLAQIERDILEVGAALGRPSKCDMPDFRALLDRLDASMSRFEGAGAGPAESLEILDLSRTKSAAGELIEAAAQVRPAVGDTDVAALAQQRRDYADDHSAPSPSRSDATTLATAPP